MKASPPRLASNIFDIIPCSCFRVRRFRTSLSPLSIDPFMYIGRTVSEFGPLGFAQRAKSFTASRSTRRTSLRSMAAPPYSRPSKSRRVSTFCPRGLATYASDRKVFSGDESSDSAAHRVALRQRLHCIRSGNAQPKTASDAPFVTL